MALAQPISADRGDEDLLTAQGEIIELIAASASLGGTLARIAMVVERLAAPALCSILLLDADGVHIRHGAAPSLPPTYIRAIDGLQIGPETGSCGTAMHRRTAVVVRDIASDPLWAPYRDFALPHGLRACWSVPIIDDSGPVLGAFALYHREPREPSAAEWRTVGYMCRLVRLAIIQHRRETVLRDQLYFSQQLLDAIPSPIFYKDAEGRYLGGNTSFERYIGMRRQDFVGKTVYGVASRELADIYEAADRALFDNPGTQVYEAKIRLPDGTERDMVFHKATFARADGQLAGLVGVILDITERKRMEAALRDSEERFRAFAEASSDWFWEQDADLRFTWASDVPPELGLAHPADFIGKARWEIGDKGPTPARWAAHRADLEARRPFRDFRFERVARDGTVHHVSVSGHPIFDDKGEFCGYRGNARDITAQVTAQAALVAAKEEAETASRTKSQFLAHMSHELRTPLNAILGFSEVIRDAVVGPVEPRYADYAGDIHKAGQHLLNLINDVLDLSKIEVGRLALHDDPVSLADVIATCCRLVSERAREGNVTITDELPLDLPAVRGDALRLKQVVLNVLSNAVKFTPPGGAVRITAACEADGGLILKVIDTGIGMAADDIPVALAPFRQVEGALSRRYEGTGLGLPLAKSLIELHEGTLEIASTVGSGTTVLIRLPARRVLQD
jgi:PAS domain S-box-containing protein